MIRVVIVDDHTLVRQGLRAVLDTSDIEVIADAVDGEQAIDVVCEVRPDVVLMDLAMPVLDGARATEAIVAQPNPPRVVVLTSFSDDDRVRDALAAGAVGYLLKDSEPETIQAAVRSAHAGHAPLDPRVASLLLPAANAPGATGAELSAREREVLVLVAQGLANKQIGRRLGITEATVKAHLGSIFRQTNTQDRTSAALWARTRGLA